MPACHGSLAPWPGGQAVSGGSSGSGVNQWTLPVMEIVA